MSDLLAPYRHRRQEWPVRPRLGVTWSDGELLVDRRTDRVLNLVRALARDIGPILCLAVLLREQPAALVATVIWAVLAVIARWSEPGPWNHVHIWDEQVSIGMEDVLQDDDDLGREDPAADREVR